MNSHREIKLAAGYNWFHTFSYELCNSWCFYPLQQSVCFQFQQSLINGVRTTRNMRGKQFPKYTHDLKSNGWTYFGNIAVLIFPFGGCCPSGRGFRGAQPCPSLLSLHPGEASHCSLARPECSRQPSAHPLASRLPGVLSGHSLYPNSALFAVSLNRHLFACITEHLKAFRKFIKERPTQITRIMKSRLLSFSSKPK